MAHLSSDPEVLRLRVLRLERDLADAQARIRQQEAPGARERAELAARCRMLEQRCALFEEALTRAYRFALSGRPVREPSDRS